MFERIALGTSLEWCSCSKLLALISTFARSTHFQHVGRFISMMLLHNWFIRLLSRASLSVSGVKDMPLIFLYLMSNPPVLGIWCRAVPSTGTLNKAQFINHIYEIFSPEICNLFFDVFEFRFAWLKLINIISDNYNVGFTYYFALNTYSCLIYHYHIKY